MREPLRAGTKPMSLAEEKPRPDLGALRIHRDEEPAERSFPVGRIVAWLVGLLVISGLAFVGYKQFVVPRSAPVVETMIIKPMVNVANPALLSASGYLVANKQSKITPKISGKVVQLPIDTGMKVRQGDVLAVLESTTVQAQLDESKAELIAAELEFKRQTAMWKQGVTSKTLLDNAESAYKAALARVHQVEINMQDMVVRAPFAGTIATKNTEVGEVISSVMMGQVAGTLPAGAICTLVDLSTLEAEVDVNEGSIAQLHEGQAAEVSVDAFPGKKWRGVLRQIIPTADRAKAIVQVKVKIVDPGDRLLPEMSSTVSFLQAARSDAELQEPAKIWLPSAAISNGHVAVVDATGHVSLRNISVGATRDGRIEVTSGVRAGERIVTDKVETYKDGQLVRLSES
jgi:RND family efflux transporter MFP subunit